MNENIPALDHEKVGQMTGFQLLCKLHGGAPGLPYNTAFPFQSGDKTWQAEMTLGRGRQSGKSYVHLWTKVTCRIVTPTGEDTGSRCEDVIRLRGLSTAKVRTYQEV